MMLDKHGRVRVERGTWFKGTSQSQIISVEGQMWTSSMFLRGECSFDEDRWGD